MPEPQKEIWINEVIKQFSHADQTDWLKGVDDYTSRVIGGKIIHLTELGVNPDVLVNNTTYPIPIQLLDGSDVPLELDKFQTTRTPISDDELYAIAYDKMKTVKVQHGDAIGEWRLNKGIHNIAPMATAAKTPVLRTTGPDDGTGRKRLVRKDIVQLAIEFNKIKVPLQNRRLVLSAEHLGDLLVEDDRFLNLYTSITQGKITNMIAGFEVSTFIETPYYNQTSGNKLSFGAITGTDDRQASIAFYKKHIFKAGGKTTAYFDKADTATQTNYINFRNYNIVLPKTLNGIGGIF